MVPYGFLFFFDALLFFSLLGFFLELLRGLLPLALEEKVDNSALQNWIAKNTTCSCQLLIGERAFTFVHSLDLLRLALFALFGCSYHMAGSLEDRHTEVALIVVAFQAPAFLGVELDAILSSEAPDAEVDSVVVVQAGNLSGQKELFIGAWVLSDPHDSHQLL